MTNKSDYVELGLACADVCKALERGLNGKELDDLSPSVREAIEQLTRLAEPGVDTVRRSLTSLNHRTVEEIHGKVTEKSGRNPLSRLVHAKNDKETISAWKLDLNRILHVFNVRSLVFTRISLIVSFQTELAVNTHVTVSDMRHDMSGIRSDVSKIREEIGGQVRSVSASCIQSTDVILLTVA